MLVLARRIGEELVIGDNIRLTVLGVKGNQVRLGIAAPPSVSIDRKEIHERRNQEFGTAGLQTLQLMLSSSDE